MSDSGNARIAAIWPLKAAKKTDWVIVPVDSIKDFKEKKNYGQQLYKYKGPGDKKSSLVFILLTGSSEKEVQASLNKGRISYPNRSLVEPNIKVTTTEEEQQGSVLQKQRETKQQGKLKTLDSILAKHLSRDCPTKKKTVKRLQAVTESIGSKSGGSKRSAEGKKVSPEVDNGAQSIINTTKPSKLGDSATKPTHEKTVDRASDEHSSHSNISVPKVNAFSQTDQTDDFLKEKITTLEENFNIIDAKFQSYQDQVKNKTNELTRRIAALERSTKQKKTETPNQHIQSGLPSSSKGPNYHLQNTELVNLGHGVEADRDVWDTLEHVTSKDDWAYGALIAVFGAESKFFRARRPRGNNKMLKVFPTSPPVMHVLKHYYKKWLRDTPAVIDYESSIKHAKHNKVQPWAEFLEQEEVEERTARRKTMIQELMKHLPALMADKATNMFRQGCRSRKRDIDSADEDEPDEGDADETDADESDADSITLSSDSDAYERETH